ncbi:MAG: toll/interleukin-1 receptor domain-containing protein [Pirellulaceae bacterium]
MSQVAFINYRRDDTGPEAKLIAKALFERLPRESVFLDSHTIESGDEWPERIRNALDQSRYVLVLIGMKWLLAGMDQWGRRRIDHEDDWVRREIALALGDKQKTVIPVLLSGAEMPPAEALPKDVAPIASRQNIVLRRDYWDHDLEFLTTRIAPNDQLDESAEANPLLKPMWNRIDLELQKIMAVAAALGEMEGKTYVDTTNFVKALMFLKPGNISDFFEELPKGALPDSVVSNVRIQSNALRKLESFSPCINSAINNLAPRIATEEKLSSEDVYIDIARYATGKSTQRLRSHGVNKENVEKIVQQLGWKLVERNVV